MKKTSLRDFRRTRKNGLTAISLLEEDELIAVRLTDGRKQVLIATEEGKFIRFHEREVRTMGRSARGVRAIELSPGTAVVGADLIDTGQEVLMVSARGYGKRVAEKEFRLQRRGGKGLIGMKISQVSGPPERLCHFKRRGRGRIYHCNRQRHCQPAEERSGIPDGPLCPRGNPYSPGQGRSGGQPGWP